MPPPVADEAKRLMALAEKGSSRSVLEGRLFIGGGYNSNATQATSLASVQAFSPALGFVAVPAPQSARSDGSLVLGGQLSHRYDLGLQREGAWETNLLGDYQNSAHINHNYDLAVVQLDTGPRIGVADLAGGAVSLRPLFSATYLA
ncbi:hypothetical protein [Dankookia sp. P2]|uniref:hypothetical protein n=1 Tax=Dankookia sp. P2 TaxID=3423955 RepID=UPI003D67ED2E